MQPCAGPDLSCQSFPKERDLSLDTDLCVPR